jgi:hypothetical protein
MRISQSSAPLAAHSWTHSWTQLNAHSARRGELVAGRVRVWVWHGKINILILVLVTNKARFKFCGKYSQGRDSLRTGLSAQCVAYLSKKLAAKSRMSSGLSKISSSPSSASSL